MVSKNVVVNSTAGIHARPATLLVKNAAAFKSNISLEYNNKKANVKSLIGVLSLAIPSGAEVTVIAEGEDETTACEQIATFISEIKE